MGGDRDLSLKMGGGVSIRDVKHDVMLRNHQIIHTIRHLLCFYMKLYIIKLVIHYGFVSI